MVRRLAALSLLLVGLVLPCLAVVDEDPTPPPAAAQVKPDDAKKAAEEYEKAVKDLPKSEGAFTLFTRKKEVLMQLGEADLGKLWLIQATLQTGAGTMDLQAGAPLGDEAVDTYFWERHEEVLWLVRPNIKYRWEGDDPLAAASQRSFPRAILGAFRIEQTNPAKKLLLVNVSSLFMGDAFRLNDLVNLSGGAYMLDREKCLVGKVKCFPQNAVVEMKLHFWSAKGATPSLLLELLGLSSASMLEDTRSLPLAVTYNLWWRQPRDYRPRLADPRVGFFTTDFFSVAKFLQMDRTERYIERFALRKKDPSAKLSEPVKPIIWILDPSIPGEYRDACRQGVLMWNRAYEALGYKNAIQVQDAPKDPDYDHADGRYNVIRWTISPELTGAYAIAQFRSDPFTGEILNAAVSVDANYLAAAFMEQQYLVVPASDTTAEALRLVVREPAKDPTPRDLLGKQGWSRSECRFAEGLGASAAFAWNVLQAAPGGVKISRAEYAKQMIRETVCHEVGHCLGLRHNFAGSTLLTTAELGDEKTLAAMGDTASVMDYTPVNVLSALRGYGTFYTPRIGVYDEWAIRYGYGDVSGDTPTGERFALAKVASESGAKGHAYMTDENADSWDPAVLRFDQAKDSLAYGEKMLQAVARVRRYAVQKLPRPGEGFEKRTQLVLTSLIQTFAQGRLASFYVGGLNGSRSFRGDPGARPSLAPVDPRLQRQAVRMIAKYCFSMDSLGIPDSVLLTLSQDPNATAAAAWTAPIRKMIDQRAMMLYSLLMGAEVLDRICENQFKLRESAGAYAIDEHFSTLLGVVFREVGGNRNVSSTRRDLQRYAVTALMTQAGAGPGAVNEDVRTLAANALRRLAHRYGLQLKHVAGLNGMTVAYLRETKANLDRFLARQITVSR